MQRWPLRNVISLRCSRTAMRTPPTSSSSRCRTKEPLQIPITPITPLHQDRECRLITHIHTIALLCHHGDESGFHHLTISSNRTSTHSVCTEEWCVIAAHLAICQYGGPSVRSHAGPSQHCVVNEPFSLPVLSFLPWSSKSKPSIVFFLSTLSRPFLFPSRNSLSTYISSSFVCTFPSSVSLPFSWALRWCSAVFGSNRKQPDAE